MANYEFTVVSNEFKTKNNEEVANVFEDLGFEETYTNSNGYVFVGSYGESAWSDDDVVVREIGTGKVIGAYDTYNGMYEDLGSFLQSKSSISDEEFSKMSVEELEDTLQVGNYEEVPLDEYLQEMLEDGQVFVLKEVGNEKLRYNTGCAVIIGKDFVEWIDLDRKIEEFVKSKGLEV